eukprot:6112567-Pleurochrysis_carterae.AAC.1
MRPARVCLSASEEGTGTPQRLRTRMIANGYAKEGWGFAVGALRPASWEWTKSRKEARRPAI